MINKHTKISIAIDRGGSRGGHGGQKTPLPESYWESLKSGVVA